jgi:hypothetical protein
MIMHPYLENELNESIEELKDKQPEFSQKQADIIKSLPEKDRLKIFQSMYADKQASSPYQMWLSLNKFWRNLIKIIILIALIICVTLYGTENGWKNFKEFMYGIGYFYN